MKFKFPESKDKPDHVKVMLTDLVIKQLEPLIQNNGLDIVEEAMNYYQKEYSIQQREYFLKLINQSINELEDKIDGLKLRYVEDRDDTNDINANVPHYYDYHDGFVTFYHNRKNSEFNEEETYIIDTVLIDFLYEKGFNSFIFTYDEEYN